MPKDRNIIQEFLTDVVRHHEQFHPTEHFYNVVGITGKRWAKLYRGEKQPNLKEMYKIADYFNIDVKIITTKRQLKLDLNL